MTTDPQAAQLHAQPQTDQPSNPEADTIIQACSAIYQGLMMLLADPSERPSSEYQALHEYADMARQAGRLAYKLQPSPAMQPQQWREQVRAQSMALYGIAGAMEANPPALYPAGLAGKLRGIAEALGQLSPLWPLPRGWVMGGPLTFEVPAGLSTSDVHAIARTDPLGYTRNYTYDEATRRITYHKVWYSLRNLLDIVESIQKHEGWRLVTDEERPDLGEVSTDGDK